MWDLAASNCKDTHSFLTNLPQKLTENPLPSEVLNRFEHIFRQRLRHSLDICDIKDVEFARTYSAQYHVPLSPATVSYWLNGKRKIPPLHYARLKRLLTSHLKMAATSPEYGLTQEMFDWDGLIYNDEQLKREKNRPTPVILGSLPRTRPGTGHFYREEIRDEIAAKLLNPDPETGVFQPGVVILTGLPGSGRTEMVLEVLERIAWFFDGGILYADMSSSLKAIFQDWGRRSISRAKVLSEIENVIRQRKGRWLLVAENINNGKHFQSILPSENLWVLATAYGVSALQPLGWEQHAFPLRSLTDEETIAWLRERLGEQWGKPYDRENARELRHLIEGLPMAAAILSAQVRSRGWRKVFDAIHDPQQAVAFIRYGSKQETPTSSLSKAIDLAFQTLTADEKAALREMAMYPPGHSVPEEIFHHFTDEYQDVVDNLVEKGLLNRFENPRWRKTVFRLHRLVALHARTSLPVDKGKLLARMMDFSTFLHLFLPETPIPEAEIFDRLYAQRKMLGFAHEFLYQLGEEANAGRFEPEPEVVIHLNASVRTCATLTWMNSGAQAAFSFLESLRQMPFITQFPEMDMALPELRSLWADVLFALGNTDRTARNGQKVLELVHPRFFEIGQVARSGDIVKFLALCPELLTDELEYPQIMQLLWIQQSLRMLFRRLWRQQRYGDLQLLIERAMPFFMAFPWRAGLEAHWWDFKSTLGARGQLAAEEKLTLLQEYERKFQEALGKIDHPYTALGEVLLHSAPKEGTIIKLREMANELKRMSQVRAETDAHHLINDLSAGRLIIQPAHGCEPPASELLATLDRCQGKLNDFLARNTQGNHIA
jgi:hypothetical protein